MGPKEQLEQAIAWGLILLVFAIAGYMVLAGGTSAADLERIMREAW